MEEDEAVAQAVASGACWPTAAIDETADFTGVDVVFGYGSLVWKPCCEPHLISEAFPAYIHGFNALSFFIFLPLYFPCRGTSPFSFPSF
jgi:hypothetical protein